MQALFEILKIIVALAVLVGVAYYWFTNGLPPRGKGRWKKVLKDLSK